MSAPDAILVVDADGRYIDVNPAAEQLTGYSHEELLTKRVGDLAVPEDRALSAERFELLRATGRSRRDRTLLRKDGTTVSVEANAMDLGDGTYQTILRDISKRVERERALQEAVRAHTVLVEICHAAVISAGADGLIRSWNPAAESLFGYSPDETIGMPIARLVPRRLKRRHNSAFARHTHGQIAKPSAHSLNTHGLRKDGSEVPVDISLALIQHGGELLFTAAIRDLSSYHQVVEQLNSALRTLQFHVDRMPLAYIVWDTDFRVVVWNPAAERIFGYTAEEADGKHAYELVVPNDVAPQVDKVWSDLLAGDASSHSINSNVRKDGTRITCEWFNTPLHDAEGNIRGVASMARDITERELMESRLRDAQKLESLGVLAGGIAHDFNSSLMVILGNTSLLRSMKGIPARARQNIELIEDAGLRASELIRHLLAYARTGRHNPQPTDLSRLIQDARLFLESSVGKSYRLTLDLAADLPPIRADRSQIEQVVLNLCVNAKQAMSPGGTIEVFTRRVTLSADDVRNCAHFEIRPGDYIELLVTDTGCGMDAETSRRIFDPFFTTKSTGHGLGLAAVSGILRQHGAAAWVDSAPDRGTRFRVYLPIDSTVPMDDAADL